MNRLAGETSPYLLQHRHNPVDWYPWGDKAIDTARRLDRPIFLSVGYSTCYWCHVMERQCFEDPDIAALMNRTCVNIKVDREERPDLDQLYMLAVQILTHQGGWPMSVFLTPDLRPFYGGTYFPPDDAHGRIGFPRLLEGIAEAWRDRRDEIHRSADQIVEYIRQLSSPPRPRTAVRIDRDFVENLLVRSTADFDSHLGGFGSAPKFPRQTLLELLLEACRVEGNPDRLRMVRFTLDQMADGGIRDQIGGAFHRYSTDARWLVPHFEIMGYDNALLAVVYAQAFAQTGDARYRRVVVEMLDFILAEMTGPDGEFYTAIDAEVDAREGASYLWTRAEIESALGAEDARTFCRVYGLDRGPNFADPHHGEPTPTHNILFVDHPPTDEEEASLARMRRRLYEVRRQRKQPLLDTKVITSWNGLMIRGMAMAGRLLTERRFVDTAVRAADFLLARQVRPDGTLWRSSRDGQCRHDGFLEDYAASAWGLLELSKSDASPRWREAAAEIAQKMLERFYDRSAGGFYFTAADAQDVLVRQKVAADSPLPSGQAMAAMVLLELDRIAEVRQTLAAFAGQLANHPEGMSSLVQACLAYLQKHEPFTVEGGGPPVSDFPGARDAALSAVDAQVRWLSPSALAVDLSISEGYHVQAADAPEGFAAARLAVEGAVVNEIVYPAGDEIDVAGVLTRVWSGDQSIIVRLAAPPTGSFRLVLSYQACTLDRCLPQASKRIEPGAAPPAADL